MANILIINFSKNMAGPTLAFEIAKGFVKNNHKVYCMVSSKIVNHNDWICEKSLESVEFIDTKNKKKIIIATIAFELYGLNKIIEKYGEINFDVAIQVMIHPWANIITRKLNVIHSMAICHDPLPHSGTSTPLNMLVDHMFKKSPEIIVLTKKFIPVVAEKYSISEEKIFYMRHGKFSTYRRVQERSRCDFYSEENINFLFFGRIEEYKGLHVLVSAYKIILKKYKDVSLSIVGSGDFGKYKEEVSGINGLFVINEYIPDESVGKYFDGPNVITVLPYLDATQSGVIPIAIEYLTPIIASDIGGIREQLYNGKIGIMCKSGSVEDLARKMELVIKNKSLRDEQIQLMEEYEHELEWDVITDKLLNDLNVQ